MSYRKIIAKNRYRSYKKMLITYVQLNVRSEMSLNLCALFSVHQSIFKALLSFTKAEYTPLKMMLKPIANFEVLIRKCNKVEIQITNYW